MPFFRKIRRAALAGLGLLGLADRPPAIGDHPLVRGRFVYRVVDAAGNVTDSGVWENHATTQGLNNILDAAFRNQTAVAQWYATPISATSFTATSTADTAASHAGWVELTTYNEATRVAWSPPAASGGVLANSSVMTFTNSSGSSFSVRGLALFSVSTKGATTGVLWNAVTDGTTKTIANGSTLQVIYQLTISPGS